MLVILVGLVGCDWPWQKKEDPTPKGRIIKDALSLYEMGRHLEESGNYPAAMAKYHESLEVSPRPKVYLALGALETDLLRFADARVHLEKALQLSPRDPAAAKALDRLNAMEDLVRRGEEIPESILRRPAPPQLSTREQRDAVSQSEVGAVQEVAEAPDDEASHAGLSMPDAEPTGGSFSPDVTAQEMIPPAETLDEEEESRVRETVADAVALFFEERYAEAESRLREAILEFPEDGRLHYHLGYACQLQGKPRTALEAYQDAVRLGYRTPTVYYNSGLCYEELPDSDLAIKAYQKALSIGGIPEAHYALGMLYEKRGLPKEALASFEAYLKADPRGAYAEDASVHVDRLKRRR